MTIVIPVRDGAHVLKKMAPAVLAQSAERIVYVDDGSRDATPSILAALAETDERVLILTHDANRGRAAARNAGIQEAVGDVLFLDADVLPAAGWAASMARALRTAGTIAVVGRLEFGDLDPEDPYHQYLASSRRGIQEKETGPASWRHFLTTAAGVRRDALRRAGGFPERVGYGEDLALACRLHAQSPAGLRFVSEARATMYDPGDLGTALDKVSQFARSLPAIVAHCPDALAVSGLERLVSRRPVDRIAMAMAYADAPARLARTLVGRLPRSVRPLAVRYLLGHALAVHAPDALLRATERP